MMLLVLMVGHAYARDGGGPPDRPRVCDNSDAVRREACANWISRVKTPDTRSSCCGPADSYIADNFELVDAQDPRCQAARAVHNDDVGSDKPCLFAEVTVDYPDIAGFDEFGNPTTTPAQFHKGDRVLIPANKVNHSPEDAGNTSGHGAFFWVLSAGVICYFAPPLI